MKSVPFYSSVMLLMPCLTVLFVHHEVGGFAAFVGFGAALVCMVLAAVLTQTASLVLVLMRAVRKFSGAPAESSVTVAEKTLLASGPVSAAVFVYAAAGAALSFWADRPTAFLAAMVGIGGLYGALISVGLFSQLATLAQSAEQ